MEEYRVRHIKLFFQKYPSALKQVRTLKNISGGKKRKVLILTIKHCCTPGKITDPNIDTCTQTVQELATALVQVHMYLWTKGQLQGEYSCGQPLYSVS
jgi:hypothetical protein